MTTERLARAPEPAVSRGSSDGPPVFIVGCPRSGTTLLRVMLDANPDLAIPPESHFVPLVWRAHRRYERLRGIDVERLVRAIRSSARVRAWDLPDEYLRARIDALREPTIPDVVAAFFSAYADHAGKTRWADKTPGYSLEIPTLSRMFPDARFIHVVRDGRDVAPSFLEVIGSKNLIEAAQVWNHRVRVARSDGERLGRERFLEVRYEELVADPSRVLKEVCSFIGIGFLPEMLDYSRRIPHVVPAREQRIHRNLAKPVTKGLRDWRRDMNARDIEAFEAVARAELAYYGYELSHPRTRPGVRARVTLRRVANGAARQRWRLGTVVGRVRRSNALPPPKRW